jgi:hypothetical protein
MMYRADSASSMAVRSTSRTLVAGEDDRHGQRRQRPG